MTKLEEKLIELGYLCFKNTFYYKNLKCIIWICLTSDKKQIKLTSIDYNVLSITRADGINAENQLQKDLEVLKNDNNL